MKITQNGMGYLLYLLAWLPHIRDHDGHHSGVVGCFNTVFGIFECDGILCGDIQLAGGFLIDIRSRFAVVDLIPGYDGRKGIGNSGSVEAELGL